MQKPGLFGMNGFIVFVLSCFAVGVQAQQATGLILIDAEGKEAFTVRIGGQMYASSAHGHLSLSHLKDSVYRLCLRFPKKNLAEQVFPVKVRQKDLGFILKGEDSSWVLYNWQTKETIHPVYVLDSSRILEMGIKREDDFSKLMASVVNDTSVMYNTYSGGGFHANDTSAIGHRIFAIGGTASRGIPPVTAKAGSNSHNPKHPRSAGTSLPPTKDSTNLATKNPSALSALPPTKDSTNLATKNPSAVPGLPTTKDSLSLSTNNYLTANPQPEAPLAIAGVSKKPDKDSLLAARRLQIHFKDSLQAARKTTIKDSLATVRLARALKDSLQAVRKVFLRDSLLQAKKMTKDSLLAVKVRNDSLKREAKNLAAVNHQPLTANPSSPDAGGESRLLTAAGPQLATNQSGAGSGASGRLNESIIPSTVNRQPSGKPMAVPKKIREVSLKISRKIVFLDYGPDGRADTVILFVYFESKDLQKHAAIVPMVVKKTTVQDTVTQNQVQGTPKTPDTAVLKRSSAGAKPDTTAGRSLAKNNEAKSIQPLCSDLASEADMLYLRTAILNTNTDQEKIAVASGGFALKCFTVAQVRQLASILISDKARYRLMDAARLHIADKEHFPELADMYTDKNFQRKFLVLAENRS